VLLWNLQKLKEIDEKFSIYFFWWFFFVFLRFPKNECISSKTKAIYPKFFQECTQNTNVIFYPHGCKKPWMGVSGFVEKTFFGGK